MAHTAPTALPGAIDLDQKGWFALLLDHVLAVAPAPAVAGPPGEVNAAGARWLVDESLRRSGLAYGTPLAGMHTTGPERGPKAAYAAVLEHQIQLANAIAAFFGRPYLAPVRKVELAVLFAASVGQVRLVEKLEATYLRGGKPLDRAFERGLLQIEGRLRDRVFFAGEPRLGLPLQRGLAWADSRIFGRLAVRYYTGKDFGPRTLERLLAASAGEKALLVEVLLGMARANEREDRDGIDASTIRRQLTSVSLPGPHKRRLRKNLARPRPPEAIAAAVKGVRLKDFLVEQALLGALIDGTYTAGERAYVDRIADALGVDALRRMAIELEVAEFYSHNRDLVDAFAVAEASLTMLSSVTDRIADSLKGNLDKLVTELKETGELGTLLARASAGQTLSAEDKRKIKAQLIDLAKAVPALAVFAAPGGLLLLPILIKVLPFNLLPSAFSAEVTPAERQLDAHQPPPKRRAEG